MFYYDLSSQLTIYPARGDDRLSSEKCYISYKIGSYPTEKGEVNTGGEYAPDPERRDAYITLERTAERLACGAERSKRTEATKTKY